MVIKVEITDHGIRMDGHACQGQGGQDIVCSAVSALTCNLINSLQELTDSRIRADTGSGRTVIEWQELTKSGRLLVDSWFLGISAIDQEYNCIKLI